MSAIHVAVMRAILIFWQAWEYLLDGIDIVSETIARHPRKWLVIYLVTIGVMWG